MTTQKLDNILMGIYPKYYKTPKNLNLPPIIETIEKVLIYKIRQKGFKYRTNQFIHQGEGYTKSIASMLYMKNEAKLNELKQNILYMENEANLDDNLKEYIDFIEEIVNDHMNNKMNGGRKTKIRRTYKKKTKRRKY